MKKSEEKETRVYISNGFSYCTFFKIVMGEDSLQTADAITTMIAMNPHLDETRLRRALEWILRI